MLGNNMADITPSQVGKQIKWDIGLATEFAADLLEDVNDHNLAAALRAVSEEEYDIACEFLQIEKEQRAAGHLTTELRAKRNALYDRLAEIARRRESEA
jgi:hypothetical protein